MKNELLLSAAILPMCGMAGEAIAASPAKGAPKEKQRPNIVLFLVDGMAGYFAAFLDSTNALQRHLPHAEYGTPGGTREDVHTSIRL